MNLDNYTSTEILKAVNDSKSKHDKIKDEIIKLTYEIERLESLINDKTSELSDVEENYVILVEELNKRNLI